MVPIRAPELQSVADQCWERQRASHALPSGSWLLQGPILIVNLLYLPPLLDQSRRYEDSMVRTCLSCRLIGLYCNGGLEMRLESTRRKLFCRRPWLPKRLDRVIDPRVTSWAAAANQAAFVRNGTVLSRHHWTADVAPTHLEACSWRSLPRICSKRSARDVVRRRGTTAGGVDRCGRRCP
jgi:hypothetical protein